MCSRGLDERIKQSERPTRIAMTTEEDVMSDYDSWIITLTEASARLDGLQTAVTEVRGLLRGKRGSAQRTNHGRA
jgi:hypothetical protein